MAEQSSLLDCADFLSCQSRGARRARGCSVLAGPAVTGQAERWPGEIAIVSGW